MPRVDDHSFCRLTDRSQSGHQQSHRHEIQEYEDAFEPGNALRQTRDSEEEDLRDWWVDRVCIFLAVNIRVNRVVPQPCKPGINRKIKIRIDAGSLEPSVPDVPIYIR